MLNQKKIEIFLTKIRKSLAKQFLEIAIKLLSLCFIDEGIYSGHLLYSSAISIVCEHSNVPLGHSL